MKGGNPCVAVVDDEASVRTALGRLLRLADFDVAAFESGEAFLASLAASHASCVLLDVHMPGLSGFDIQARLRAAHVGIPVVFMTASDDKGLDAIASAAGGTCLLRKPFSSAVLLESICAAIRSRPCSSV